GQARDFQRLFLVAELVLGQLGGILLQLLDLVEHFGGGFLIAFVQRGNYVQFTGNGGQWFFIIGDDVLDGKILLFHADGQVGNGDGVLCLVARTAGQVTRVV